MAAPPVQPQSKRILSNLLSKLQSPNSPYNRFSEFVNQTQQLEELMYHCVRIDIIALVDGGRLRSINKKRSEDSSYTGRAIYLHVVEGLEAEGFYVGQALNLHNRMKEHMSFRSRRDKPSLHYHALQRSKSDYYVILSYVPDLIGCRLLGIQDSRLFLDLLETWCCLMLRTLPKKYLEEFLPKDIQMPKETCKYLNLKLPLQGPGSNWLDIRNSLLESPDSLYQDYYFDAAQRYHQRTPELTQYRKHGLDICKNLDRITIPGSIPTRPTVLSPPSTTIKTGEKIFQPEAAKQTWLSTPPSTTLKVRTNQVMDDVSQDSGPARVRASNSDKSEQEKRKRKSHEEPPSEPLEKRSAKRIQADSASLTAKPVCRTLDFNSPKEVATEAVHDFDPDMDSLPDEDWSLDQNSS